MHTPEEKLIVEEEKQRKKDMRNCIQLDSGESSDSGDIHIIKDKEDEERIEKEHVKRMKEEKEK